MAAGMGGGAWGAAISGGVAVFESLKSTLPYLEDECTVVVHGNPKAKRAELYFLAAATAFALVKRIDVLPDIHPPPSMIMIEYDAASNVVQFTIRMKTNLVSAGIAGGGPRAIQKLPILSGPAEEVKGEDFHFATAGIGPGRPVALPGRDKMRFFGRPIVTRNPTCEEPDPSKPAGGNIASPNPRPSGDARSRGSLYQMVYAALSTPQGAGLKEFPAPTDATKFIGG